MMGSLGRNGAAVSAAAIAERVAHMKQAHVQDGPASLALRRDRLERAAELLVSNQQALVAAMNADYGQRSRTQSLSSDLLASVRALTHAREHVANWMRPGADSEPFPGAQARIQYQPLGVVGIISPWNFPVNLAFSPLAGILAAGNRALLKPSELTPNTAELLAELVDRRFDADEFALVLGDAAVGTAFGGQAFDHLIFTGSTAVARHVMRAAAENLVPLTLELGGKSPVIVAPDADLRQVAERVMTVKTFNAGQICLAPDYILLPEGSVEAFAEHARDVIAQAYPTLADNPDYTAIVNTRHFDRLQQLLADAAARGARVLTLNPAAETLARDTGHKIAPTLILDADDSMLALQEEIFGPILPVLTYRHLDDAIAYVNAHPRPLAAYFFGHNAAEQARVAERTTSGALVVNDVMTHAMVEELPFGGVGPSGMGRYHGQHGFQTFSHPKAVLIQSPGGESNLRMRAPYRAEATGQIEQALQRELQNRG